MSKDGIAQNNFEKEHRTFSCKKQPSKWANYEGVIESLQSLKTQAWQAYTHSTTVRASAAN